jgi:hypothetical protein
MKHWEQKFATYMYNHCNIALSRSTFATSIRNTCNIPLKHLKHTLAICISSATSTCCLDHWRLVDASSMPQSGTRLLLRRPLRGVGRRGGERHGGQMARQRGRMADGVAGAWWREWTVADRAWRWHCHAGAHVQQCERDGGAVNGEE